MGNFQHLLKCHTDGTATKKERIEFMRLLLLPEYEHWIDSDILDLIYTDPISASPAERNSLKIVYERMEHLRIFNHDTIATKLQRATAIEKAVLRKLYRDMVIKRLISAKFLKQSIQK